MSASLRGLPTSQTDHTTSSNGSTTLGADRTVEAHAATADLAPDDVLAPGTVIGRFIVHRTLGAGGTGVVYAAHDPELDRTIALKVLRRELVDLFDARARFLREAQALARLPHPNVIAVYDVGAAGDRTFIAMEYIHGRTFDTWTAASRRSWSEVVAVLIKAGRGLAAAHAAGIVHRDFKPANLLVGDDGRVVVTDFGLARAVNAPRVDELAAPGPRTSREVRSSALAQSLTRTGAVQGTPAYMAPEQQQGLPADARADQFSLCVTLYEAIFGIRPLLPASPLRSPASQSSAAPTATGGLSHARPVYEPSVAAVPNRGRSAPAWLQRAILRGLCARPDDRYPSVDGLLAALHRGMARRRRWAQLAVAAAALVAIGVGIAGYVAPRHSAIALCAGAQDKLAEMWSASSRADMRSAFAATGVSYAADSWTRLEPVLDVYATAWATMHREACEATRLRGEQSEQLMDRRMACLDVRRRELDQLTRLLRRPDAGIVEHAIPAARGLSSIQDCADLAALTRTLKPPPDPIAAAHASAARQVLADARVLLEAGKYDDGLALVGKLAGDPVTHEYLPLRAEVSYRTGQLRMSKSEWERARPPLEDAIWAAEASGHDEIAIASLGATADAFIELDNLKVAHDFIRRGEAALLRFPAPPLIRVQFRTEVCVLAYREAHEAVAPCHEAVDLARRELGPDHLSVARALVNLGAAVAWRDDYEQALAYSREALAIFEKALGPDHPLVGRTLSNIASDTYRLGRIDEALSLSQRALGILERALGPDNIALTGTLNNLGNVLKRQHRYPESLAAFRRAVAITEKAVGPDHSRAALLYINIANVLALQNDYAAAIEHNQRGAAILKATNGTHDVNYGGALMNICDAEYKRRRPREALAVCMQGLPIMEQALEPASPVLAELLVNTVAPVYVANGRRQEAIVALERGISHWPEHGAAFSTVERATGELALARLLWDRSPGEHARARAQATSARDRLRSVGIEYEARRAEADAWLASHR